MGCLYKHFRTPIHKYKNLETLCILRNVKVSRFFVFMNYSTKYFMEVFFHSLLV